MTIVAFRDGVMAADSLWHDGQLIGSFSAKTPKIVRVRDGAGVVGYAGNWGWLPVVADILERRTVDELIGSRLLMRALEGADWEILYAIDGMVITAGNENPPHIAPPPFAIGSGAQLAIGAMDAGCNAKEAARIAAARSATCGGKIMTLEIPWTEKPSKKPSPNAGFFSRGRSSSTTVVAQRRSRKA